MEEKRYLKWYNKVGYGSGDVAGNVVYAFLSTFVMLYLTNTVGLNPGIVGTLIAVSKLFDGVTDIFFGSMITEGIVALIWAAAATYFYHNNGMGENNAAVVVDSITKEWLGTVGGILAVLGVIAAPITSGDTAFRSARLIVADFLHLEQRSVSKRLMICIPLFLVAIALLLYSQKDKDGFDMIWRYFAWSNQTLAVFTLWALTVYLVISKKSYIVTLIPALFMTAVCSTYIFVAPEGLGMENGISQIIGFAITIVVLAFFLVWKKKTGNI